MAINMWSEGLSPGTSPRISFSHDLCHPDDGVPIQQDYPCATKSSMVDSTSDFNFWVSSGGVDSQPSSADELFSDGLIRPLHHLQQKSASKPQSTLPCLPPQPSTHDCSSKPESSKVVVEAENSDSDPKPQSKSFWRFKRSASLQCENTYKKSSIWSLPLLLRSNSTGSVPNKKQSSSSSSSKVFEKQNSLKQPRKYYSATSSPSSSSFYVYPLSQKPPLKKHYYPGSNGNLGVRISPVLNVPPPYISKGTANLFGLSSWFRNGKHNKNKQ